jgi:PAS domain S-box-containing protein
VTRQPKRGKAKPAKGSGDLATHVQAEAAALRERDFSQAALDSLPGLFYLFNDQGRFLRWNKSLERASGYSAEELTRISPLDLFDEPDRGLIAESIGRVFSTGEATAEAELRSKDGTKTPYFFTGKRFALDGQPCLVGMGIDVTQRKEADARLRDSEARFRQVVEHIHDAVIRDDAAGKITFANDQFLALFGFTREQFPLTIDDLFAAEWRAQMHDRHDRRMRGESANRRFECEGLAQDGRRLWLEVDVVPLVDDSGRVIGTQSAIRDISERRRAEDSLRDAEARYRSLFEQSPNGILLIDPETGATIEANETAHRQLGYTREEFAALKITDYEASETPAETAEHLKNVFREGSDDFETLQRTKSGQIRNVHVWAKTVRLGDRVQFYTTFEDITERKQAEQALRESESRYRSLFENQLDGYAHCRMLYDDRGRPVDFLYLDVNEAFVRLTGLTDVVGKNVSEVIPGIREASPELFDAYARVVSTGIPETFEFDFKSQSQWLNISVYRPEPGTFIALFEDITERRRAEQSLLLQSAALNAAANAIVITDREGTIVWVNAAFSAVTGYSAGESVGRNPRDLVKSGIHDEAFYRRMWDTILAGQVWHGEIMNRRKDGRVYPEEQTITPVRDARGEIAHFIAIKRDLTAERQLQAQFLQAQKMESVGQLAGGIAHDFNNLLTVINSVAQLALADATDRPPLHTDLTQILQAGERAAALTRQLLAFSRRQVMTMEVLNLGTLVTNLQSMLQRLIGEDIELVVVPATGLGSVRADAGQIEQVVLNLAVNARDAMPTGGRLTIETHDVELDERYTAQHPSMEPGPHVMLAVSDTGVGMDETTRLRIFEPFFTTKELGKGTGLGLSSVFGIVKQSRGNIWVYSEPGRGTTFKIYFPRVDAATRMARPARSTAPVHGTGTILVVEDEPALRDVVTRILRSVGYTVVAARNGGDALRLLELHAGPVHLMLTDVVMPGISGPELAARMAAVRPEMKVIYTSGYADDAVLRHGVLSDTIHFVGKPYTIEALTSKVREVLGSP